MLRNSTKQFRQRYQGPFPRPYTTNGILNLRLTRETFMPHKEASSPRNVPTSPQRPIAMRKLEQSISTATRTMQVKTKQSVELGHRKQLTAPLVNIQTQADNETSISSIKWKHNQCDSTLKRDPKEFINSLQKNAVFYCCSCYQYVFQIEKQRHYPDCKDRVDFNIKHSQSFRESAWQRLQRIHKLAKYAKVKQWQIEELYNQIKNSQFSKIYTVSYPRQSTFFTLDEVVLAFVFTYETLLKGAVFVPMPFFTCE